MKRNLKSFGLLVMIVVIVSMFLGGCCCITCPSYPQPQFKPQILTEITCCPVGQPPYNEITKGMINHMRDIAPFAYPRWPAKEVYQLTSVEDTQKVINNINIMSVDIISTFHAQPGCGLLPFGYVKYPNGMETYITAVWDNWNNKVEFYKVTNGGLIKMSPDYSITEIVLY